MKNEKKIEFAVKALIINEGRFLAVRRSQTKWTTFELPGGRMEFGETAEETVVREVFEETGLHVTPLVLVDTWNYVTETWQITGIIYLCSAKKPGEIVLSEEHDHYEWLSPDADSLEKMGQTFRPQMLRWDWDELIRKSEVQSI